MNYLQFLLMKLSEECNEVGKLAAKSMQFGLLSDFNGHFDKTNKELLHQELNDLNAIVQLLNKEFDFNYSPDQALINIKKVKVNKFLNHSLALGCVVIDVPKSQWSDEK